MKASLAPLRDGLLRLHKILLDSERAAYELDVRPIASNMDMLGLLMHDPWFTWLRDISLLVVAIDEALAGTEQVTAEAATAFLAQTRSLLKPEETGVGFGRKYDDAMQRDPDVILAHGEMMRLLNRLEA
ncbi:MAG: hypothetical protein NTY38_10465 [Acidobacteria bacterium]|nr:hypothetical protein [Acidobacteriota bacterium]